MTVKLLLTEYIYFVQKFMLIPTFKIFVLFVLLSNIKINISTRKCNNITLNRWSRQAVIQPVLRTFANLISQIVLKNFIKISIIIKECSEEILIKLSNFVLKILKSSWNTGQVFILHLYKSKITCSNTCNFSKWVTGLCDSQFLQKIAKWNNPLVRLATFFVGSR